MKRVLLVSPPSPTRLFGADFHFRRPCLSLLNVTALKPPGGDAVIVEEKAGPSGLEPTADLVGITAVPHLVHRDCESGLGQTLAPGPRLPAHRAGGAVPA